jgi:hypothetical protein
MKSKIQTIIGLMEHSRFGVLAEHFVLDAIQKQANLVSGSDPSSFNNPLLGGKKWHDVAKEIKAKLDRSFL